MTSSLLWNVAICFPSLCNPLVIAAIGFCAYWQILYGTIIYALSYVFNRRYVGRPIAEVLAFVGFANSLWFGFPILALYAAWQLLQFQDCTAVFMD